MKITCGRASSAGRVTTTVSIPLTRAGSPSPISRQSRGAHAPAATTTAPASIPAVLVSTPVTRLPRRRILVTGAHWRSFAPRSVARRRSAPEVAAGVAQPRAGARASRGAARERALLAEDDASAPGGGERPGDARPVGAAPDHDHVGRVSHRSVSPGRPPRPQARERAWRGSSASRSPSPRKLKLVTATVIITPGKIATHGAVAK